jgi:hypothetical protein
MATGKVQNKADTEIQDLERKAIVAELKAREVEANLRMQEAYRKLRLLRENSGG